MLAGLASAACADPNSGDRDSAATTLASGPDSTTSATTTPTTTTPTTDASGTTSTEATTATDPATGPDAIFDLGAPPDLPGGVEPPTCTVIDDMDAVGDCSQTAPPDSFEPDVQWEWLGDGAEIYVVVTPLVANLTDDDDNDTIDLCDIPDIVVVAFATLGGPAHIHVLDGETGTLHYTFPDIVDFSVRLSEMKWEKAGIEEYGGRQEMAAGAQ